MPSKKLTSALVATLLLSHTVLAPLAAVAQEQDVTRQVQETQRQSTDDSQATSLPETPTTSPSSEVSSNTSSDSVNEEAGQETPTQDDSQMQTETENSESSTVSDDSTAMASDSNTSKTSEVARTKATPTPDDAFTVSGGVITGYDATLGGTDVVIPDSINGTPITTIADSAFSNKGLTSVTFPNTVTRIDRLAFDNNPNLTNVQLPSNLTTIGMGAFRECGLTNVVIPDSVTTLDSYAFYWNKLTDVTIGSGVSYISTFAFANNPLVNVNLGNVTRIGAQAFTGTTINELVVPATVQRIERQAFENANINKLVLTEGLSYIGEAAFRNSMFQTLELPNSVTTIEKRAFVDGKLTTVKIGTSLKTINSSTFAGNQISTIDFSNVETIGEQAFIGNNLGELTLPNALTTIGNSAFSNSNIHTIHWGNSIKNIGSSAFSSNQIKKLTVTAEKIGYGAFGRNPLEEVTLADSVKTVDTNAFMGDSNNPTLKKIDLGQGVENIGNNAFSWGLVESLQLPASLKTVSSGAFSYNKLAYLEPGSTNPKINYGRQVLNDRNVVNNSQEKTITINLTELYPGIDPRKITITRIRYGVSTQDTPFTYDSETGNLTFDSKGSTGSTIYYDYKVDEQTVLSVEQYWRYINQWTVTWKDWNDSIFQKDVLEGPYGSVLMATYPTNSPTRLGYTFRNWSRENYTGGGPELRIESDASFKAHYTQNNYQLNYNYNYPDGTTRIDKTSTTWEKDGLNNRYANFTGYDFLGWEYNGQLVTSTDTVATLLNNVDPGDGAEITFTARWTKKKVYMTVPDTIDFGSHVLSIGEKTYGATVSGDSLKVYDDRGNTYSWKVTAKLTNELVNESGDQILNALHYQTGNDDKIFSSSSAIDIASGKGTKDISASWSDSEGLLLKVDSSKYKTGEYSSTIEWTLNDAP